MDVSFLNIRIELRFDTETNLGKFGYIKGDKSVRTFCVYLLEFNLFK